MTTEAPLPTALARLRDELAECSLALATADADVARRTRKELIDQVDDYLLPRVAEIDAPLLVVIGGSTGAGKSTLANSIVGAEVSPAGVLRPTTKIPVLICYPGDARWFSGPRVFPGLPRTAESGPRGGHGVHVVTDPDMPPGFALLDAPDIDSLPEHNRELATELLGAADFWLFVTTASRYADAVPWELLEQAGERRTELAVVLNRVPEDAIDEVPDHLAAMLEERGLEGTPLFTIPEVTLDDGLIPLAELDSLAEWLNGLAASSEERARVVRSTLEGTLDSIDGRVAFISQHLDAQKLAAARLADEVGRSYGRARAEIEEGLGSGTLLPNELVEPWLQLVAPTTSTEPLEARAGSLGDRIARAVTRRMPTLEDVTRAIESSFEMVIVAASDRAAEAAVEAWRATEVGAHVLARADIEPLRRSSSGLHDFIDTEVRAWRRHVMDLAAGRADGEAQEGAPRDSSVGGTALMVGVFTDSGEDATDAAAAARQLLDGLFGDEAARVLWARARADLLFRVDRLLAGEASRFDALIRPLSPLPDATDRLEAAVDDLRRARK